MEPRRRAQHRVPLRQLHDPALLVGAAHQQVVLDVQQPGHLVGTLDLAAQLVEVPALVAEEGAFRGAGVGLHAFLDAGAQARQGVAFQLGGLDGHGVAVEHVELGPHLRADEGAQLAGVGAGGFQAVRDAGGVEAVAEVELLDAGAVHGQAALAQAVGVGVDGDQGGPGLGLAARAFEGLRHVNQAGQVLDALQVAGHPEQALGVAGQQGGLVQAHANHHEG